MFLLFCAFPLLSVCFTKYIVRFFHKNSVLFNYYYYIICFIHLYNVHFCIIKCSFFPLYISNTKECLIQTKKEICYSHIFCIRLLFKHNHIFLQLFRNHYINMMTLHKNHIFFIYTRVCNQTIYLG